MKTLYDPAVLQEVERRVAGLSASTPRKWGKMDAAQMLAHCSAALEIAAGDVPSKQALIGKILGPFFRTAMLGPKPFSRNGPTGPNLLVRDARDFGREKARLLAVTGRFARGGPAGATRYPHGFLGPISGEEWGTYMYKHLDHHLQQFGV